MPEPMLRGYERAQREWEDREPEQGTAGEPEQDPAELAQQAIHADIAECLDDLLLRAAARGFVIEVRLEPLQPLAMGNYRMLGTVRPARTTA
jgi:hypothetical protein